MRAIFINFLPYFYPQEVQLYHEFVTWRSSQERVQLFHIFIQRGIDTYEDRDSVQRILWFSFKIDYQAWSKEKFRIILYDGCENN